MVTPDIVAETKGGKTTSEPKKGKSSSQSNTEMIKISIGRSGKFESTETDIIKCLVIDAEGFICVLNQLMNREGGIVRLNHSVANLQAVKKIISINSASNFCIVSIP